MPVVANPNAHFDILRAVLFVFVVVGFSSSSGLSPPLLSCSEKK